MLYYATMVILLAVATIAAAGCTTASQPPAYLPTACPPPVCLAVPRSVEPPPQARQTAPDPTRDAMTAEMRRQLTDRMTDHIYAGAIIKLTVSHPADLPHHLADRNRHDQCLSATRRILFDYTEPAQPEHQDPRSLYQEQTDAFTQCLTEGAADWETAVPAERSLWLRHILAAAARTNDPSEYHRHLLHNEHTDPGWVELHQEFRQCQALAAPVSDHIAVVDDPTAVSAQVRQAIGQIADCNSRLTQIRYPEIPADSTPPSPAVTPASGNASTPPANDSDSPPAPSH